MSECLVVCWSKGCKEDGQDGCWPSVLGVLSQMWRQRGDIEKPQTCLMPLSVLIKALKGTPPAKHRDRSFINYCLHLNSLWLKWLG